MAKNYRNSDYALNKYSKGIVYRFADRIIEVTLADYLAENPDKTEQDFLELKALSDSMFLEQDRAEYNQTRKNDSIHDMEETMSFGSVSLDDQYIEIQDQQYAAEAIKYLFNGNLLTEVQRRRFILYFLKGLSHRQIADVEGTSHVAIIKSIHLALSKIERFFKV